MTAQKAMTTKKANSAMVRYWPLAIPALKIRNSLMKRANGGAPAIANAPAANVEGGERRKPGEPANGGDVLRAERHGDGPAAKKQKDLAMACPVI